MAAARKSTLELSSLAYQEFFLCLLRIYNRQNNRSCSRDGTFSHTVHSHFFYDEWQYCYLEHLQNVQREPARSWRGTRITTASLTTGTGVPSRILIQASYSQQQQEVGHGKPGLAAQAEQSGLAVPQVRQLPDLEHHFCTVVELELLCMWNSLSLRTSRLNSLSSLPPRLDNLALLSSRWYLCSTELERCLQTHSLSSTT